METREFNPPYLPFKTLTNLFDRLAAEGIPNRIDRTYLSHLAGITQTYLLAALRTFDLIDPEGDPEDKPTGKLIAFVKNPDQRKAMMGELVRSYYPEVFALGSNATHGELDDLFKTAYGVQGDTRRKAITFFLNAATFGDVPLSPHFKTPRPSGGGSAASTPRKRRTTRRHEPSGESGGSAPAAPTVDALRSRYIDMLMKRVENQDELDDRLLDRIESLLGYDAEPANEEDEEEE